MGQRRAARIRGREEGGAGAERESGGEWERGPRRRGAGDLIPSGVGAGEVVGRQRAPVPTRSGEQEGDVGVSWAGPGSGRGWRPSLGRGSVQTGHGSSGGGKGFSFFSALFVLFSVFCFLFICLFSFLFYFI